MPSSWESNWTAERASGDRDWGTWTLPLAEMGSATGWRPWGLGPLGPCTGVERSKPGRRNANSVPRDQLLVPWCSEIPCAPPSCKQRAVSEMKDTGHVDKTH